MTTGDLRQTPSDAFWARLQAAMGEDGLLTYRYLGRKDKDMHGVPHASMAIRRDMRGATGGLMAAPLAIATAETGFTDFNAVPAPVTAGLSILDPGVGVREIRMQCEVVRTGRTLGFSRTTVTDADDPGRVIAVTRGVGIKLGEAPPEGGAPFPLPEAILDSSDLPPLHQVFGGYRDMQGRWCLPALQAANRSTSGSLHLGPIHVVMEAAAAELVAERCRSNDLQIQDWDVMFVAAGAVGPFPVKGEVSVGRSGRAACRLTLTDAGRGDRVVASASAVYGAI